MATARNPSEKLAALSRCMVFEALSQDMREELVAHAYSKGYAAGDLIFAAGDGGQTMMAVLKGTVRIGLVTATARDLVLTDCHQGDVFGEVALFDGGPRSADARATTNVELLVLERRDVLAVLERHPAGALRLLELLCARLRRSDERMIELAFLDISTRLALALLRILESPNHAFAKRPVRLSLSQTELANMIGSARENVNRCLKSWEKREIVDLKDGWLIITDEKSLRLLADRE
ncbi:Crp/Fnr family transcriptional regulator [Jiella pacifica]|uniref:Cyclic nucleotide-binding domain-containing protein n=1 Tax=Jiella pacifica TaxID=2696469 RepID=A0A6N9SV25_9HYPH|nr:Crp/Fnr family transcriptional regulator [Jiella pacifica]NDW02900.1 cyclic nucleotide-binding domain-containing protein [Jiella pacifica]